MTQPKLVKQSEFARMKGVSEKSVSVWKREGRLVMVGGMVDAEASQRKLAENAGKRSIAQGKALPETPASKKNRIAVEGQASATSARATAPQPELETADLEAVAAQADAFAKRVLAGDYPPVAESDRVKGAAIALQRMLAVRRTAGELVEKSAVVDAVFKNARQQRDIFLSWPSKIGPLLAADLNCDAGRVTGLLSDLVHELCLELSGVEDTFEIEGAP
jgi:hypothetical protein